jgi:putative flavoprotein involved in K+ transport
MRRTDTLIAGAGQAGLALSRFLTLAGQDHVVLERGRVGERWRSERWDSLHLLTPNWLNVLPGSAGHDDPDGFLDRDGFAAYLERYAASSGAPVVEHAEVRRMRRDGTGFRVDSDAGRWLARHVVVATGDCDLPRVPAAAAELPDGVTHLHTSRYRSPDALPPGGVLVVGAGASGQQVALELQRSGRDVFLAVGRHARAPRRYRGRDVWAWLALLGDLAQTVDEVRDPVAARRAPTFPLNGSRLDLRVLHDAGVVVTGRLVGIARGRATFDTLGLAAELAAADHRMGRLLERIDAHIGERGLDVPDEPHPDRVALPPGPASLKLLRAGVRTVIWATGYRRGYPWLDAPALGADGELVHRRGQTVVPGLHVLGLRFQHRRSSHLIGGVGTDARLLADRLLDAPTLQEAA